MEEPLASSLEELVARKIWEAFNVTTDEGWARLWEWHTRPTTVQLGGIWGVLAKASDIIDLVTANEGSGPK